MKAKFLINAISVILIYTFCQCTQSNDKEVKTCLDPILENAIKSYINEREHLLIFDYEDGNIDTIFNYFIVYFHNQENNTFFTIFQCPWPSYVLFPEVKKNKDPLIHLSFTINQRTVTIISNQSIPTYDLIGKCGNKNQIEKTDVDSPIYDGSFYPETYQYSKLRGQIIITKLDNPILDFKPGWKEYEDLHIKKAKGKRKRRN